MKYSTVTENEDTFKLQLLTFIFSNGIYGIFNPHNTDKGLKVGTHDVILYTIFRLIYIDILPKADVDRALMVTASVTVSRHLRATMTRGFHQSVHYYYICHPSPPPPHYVW